VKKMQRKISASDSAAGLDWRPADAKSSVPASAKFRLPSAKVWRSRISWRIAFSAFLTILTVQIGILTLAVKSKETTILGEIRELGRTAISPAMDETVTDFLSSPIGREKATRVLSSTIVEGMAVYSLDFSLLSLYGEPVSIIMAEGENQSRTQRSADGTAYEVVYRPADLRRPYIVVARLNAERLANEIYAYVEQTILIMLLMSAFVTMVLMMSLGHWLLEPILFLRENLLAATDSPENPNIKDSPFDPSDEIGSAITLAQRLIRQNADNIRQIKSAAEDKIHKLAYYDGLTGLPNRTLFLQTLTVQAQDAGRFAVIVLDIDHFKDINDSMGHNVGDAILRAVGKRLRASMPESAMVARSGEDEFAITMPLSTDINRARDIAEKVKKVIAAEPFKVFNENFQVRISVGVATYPDDSIEPDQVLKNADIALNRAKEDGRDTIKEYSEDFDRVVQQRFQLLRDLRDALDNRELSLDFQPQFDLSTGRMIGAEALLRWFKKDNSREGGKFISPAEFIPVAEQSGLIVPIGEWVMNQACRAAAQWHKAGHPLRVAVNVSGAQFYQSDLVGMVRGVLDETGLEAKFLELEVTESMFMQDITHTIDTLKSLNSLGVEVAIDDFGTGYSSLSYLRQFPIDRLKIDQSFIRNALNNPDDASIARTIVRLGHSLNLRVIAEGVETREHEALLRAEGCDEVQGYRYSRPVPPEKLMAFIAGYKGDLSVFDH